jgi:hypothetical protein
MLQAQGHGPALADLAEVTECVQAAGRRQVSLHVEGQTGIGAAAFHLVVDLQGPALHPALFGRDRALEQGPVGQRSEAELADEAAAILTVGAGILHHGPNVPLVPVALALAVGVRPRVRAARPIGPVRIQIGAQVLEHPFIDHLAPAGALAAAEPSDVPRHLVLVVAAPEREAGMPAQAAQGLDRLGFDLADEIGVLGHLIAGEGEILPDEEAATVAGRVKVLALVEAAAPDPQHAEVRVRGRLDQGFHAGRAEPP